jgi:hypothetical protein
MFNGGDEDVSKYGAVDSDESIRERLVFTKSKATEKEIIKILSKKIAELEEDIGFKDRLLSELQSPAKWYDNIPEQGVLCWCEGRDKGKGFLGDIPRKRILARIDSYTPKPTSTRKDSFTANWGFLNREHWVWYENVQPLTNEEIEEFKR